MGHHADVLMALAEREQAARRLSAPPDERATPAVEVEAGRQPQDVTMCRWLSAWLVSYWLTHAPRK